MLKGRAVFGKASGKSELGVWMLVWLWLLQQASAFCVMSPLSQPKAYSVLHANAYCPSARLSSGQHLWLLVTQTLQLLGKFNSPSDEGWDVGQPTVEEHE